jgi:hypothetical protein
LASQAPLADDDFRKELYRGELERRRAREDAEMLSQDLRAFGRAAWKVIKPIEVYKSNWHIDAICEHLSAVSRGDITRLQI